MATVTINSFNYTLLGLDATITSYNGTPPSNWNLVIPSTITYLGITYTVKSIGDFAFQDKQTLVSVTIPNSVTNIGENSFEVCTSLTSINIPSSVTTIGNYAFSGCTSLTNITINSFIGNLGLGFFGLNNANTSWTFTYSGAIPDGICYQRTNVTSVTLGNGITSIGNDAFTNCTGLTSINIPNLVTSIGNNAFTNCTGLTSVTLGNGITRIGDNAFRQSGLTSITIPSSVTSIGSAAFAYTPKLTNINVDSNNPNYSSQDGVLFNKNKTILIKYPTWNSRLTYTVPSTVTTIENRSFGVLNYLENILQSVVLNEGLLTITDFAFRACIFSTINIPASLNNTSVSSFSYAILTNIIVDVNNLNFSSQDGVLFNKTKTTIIKYPFNNLQVTYSIPSSVTSIYNFAFATLSSTPLTYKNLQTVIIPNSVTSINNNAFQDNALTSVTIGNSVTSIGSYAFSGSGLTSVTIPSSVTTILEGAFNYCNNLTSVTFLGLIPTIERYNFTNTIDNVIYNETLNIGNPNLAPMLALFTTNVPICFPGGTPVVTDQGIIEIQKINSAKNTIRGKKIVAITKTITIEDKIVCIEKDALAPSVPSQKTLISRNHKLFYNKQMIKAKNLVGQVDGIYNKKYNGEILYNVLLETYEKMLVNNLIVETLDPTNIVAQLYNGSLSNEEINNLILNINHCVNKYKKQYGKLK